MDELLENKYQIIDTLGEGGMSVVYLAKDIRLQKYWAIKKVNKSSLSTTSSLMIEANILKKLDHQALPRIVDIIEAEDEIYVVLDFIDGISLDKKLKEEGPIKETQLIEWAKQICDVLTYLHTQKPNPIIYRDMKPGNIMLTGQNRIKLIDFGIAREYKEDVSTDTTHIGTRGYAAPEQYGRHQTDARTDIYSLGVTLYHLATGKSPNDPPFELKPVRELNPFLSEGFEYIILKCTQPDPNYRYQTANELLNDLKNIHKLNSAYKKKMRNKFIKVAAVCLSFMFFAGMTAVGAHGIKEKNQQVYESFIENGTLYERKSNYDDAIKEYKKAIDMDPSVNEAYLSIAGIYSDDMLDNENCISFLEDAVSKNRSISKDPEILHKLGIIYFQEGYYTKASEDFSKIKDNKFDDLKYYKTISNALGSKSKDTGEITKAIDALEQHIEESSQDKDKINAYILLSSIYMENSDVFSDSADKVIEVLEKAKSKLNDVNNVKLFERLGQAYYNKGALSLGQRDVYKSYLQKSLDYYNQVISLGYKSASIYVKIGDIYRYIDDFQQSEKTYKEAIADYPNDVTSYARLGLLYIDMKQLDKAKQCYEDAQKVPNSENDPEFDSLKKALAQ